MAPVATPVLQTAGKANMATAAQNNEADDCPAPQAEANAKDAKSQRKQGTPRQLPANQRADPLRALHLTLRLGHYGHDLLFDLIAGVQRRTHRDVIFTGLVGLLNGSVCQVDRCQCRPHLPDIDSLG